MISFGPKCPKTQLAVISFIGVVCGLLLVPSLLEDSDAQLCMKTCQKRNEAAKKKDTGALAELKRKIGEKNFISIRVSESCKRLEYCPNIHELALAWDNSNRFLSGDFFYDNETEQWKRGPPRIYNIFEQYKFTTFPWIVWVDPDDYTWKRTKQVLIVPHLSYKDPRETLIENIPIRYEYLGLHIEECHKATIGWKNNGSALLADVMNHFYSDCAEPLEYDPTIEIFMGSKIFPECDKQCFLFKEFTKRELKAMYQTEAEFAEKEDRPQTIKEKIAETKSKQERYEERLKELEEIQECKKFKQYDKNQRTAANIDCNDEKQRADYLEEKRKEYPDGIKSVQKLRKGN